MPSLRITLSLVAAATLITPASSAYTLKDNYDPSSFFSKFSFLTDADPSHGVVDYVSQSDAQGAGLIQSNTNSVYMGVDMNNTATGRGRKSVRLSSNKNYDQGLFVIDVAHVPVGCGAWPAFWLLGPSWPSGGEIDIIEGVDVGSTNQMTLHTSSGCTISRPSKNDMSSSSSVISTTCASSNGNNEGCPIKSSDTASYGTGLNAAGGAVFATEVTDTQIAVYFWGKGDAPSDVTGGNPDPSSWGSPSALFEGCDVKSYFKDMQIVFDTTFCGDWANSTWATDDQCSNKAPTCEDYVRGHPEGFSESFWTVNSLKVYSGSANGNDDGAVPGGRPSSTTAAAASPTPKGTSTRAYTPAAHTPYTPSASPGGTTLESSAYAAGNNNNAGAGPSFLSRSHPSGTWTAQPRSWGAWGGHGGRGRPTDTPGEEQKMKRKRHAAEHVRMGRARRV